MWLFDDQETWDRFYKICLEWVGTPFHHCSMVKGQGADCSTFIGGMFLDLGIITDVKYEFYDLRWFDSKPNLLVESVENNLKKHLISGLEVEERPIHEEPMRGDIGLVWTYKKGIPSHSVICLEDDKFIHCRWGNGVEIMPFKWSWAASRIEKIYRIKKVGI